MTLFNARIVLRNGLGMTEKTNVRSTFAFDIIFRCRGLFLLLKIILRTWFHDGSYSGMNVYWPS